MATITPTKPAPLKPRRRMLGPAAYSETVMPSLRLARSSRLARRIGKVLLGALILGFLLVAFAPWQQTVKGTGTVLLTHRLNDSRCWKLQSKAGLWNWAKGFLKTPM